MPIAPNRELIQISVQAYRHIQKIKQARKRMGLPYTVTGIVSELILSQPIPKSVVMSHVIGQEDPQEAAQPKS